MSLGVPKIIHHLWPGDDAFPATREGWTDLTAAHFHAWRASWQVCHPDWTMMFWRRALTADPRVNALLTRTDVSVAAKSDVLRWQVLFEHGGVYADVDVECIRALDARWQPPADGVLLVEEWPRTDLYSPSLLVAAPGSAAVGAVRDALVEVTQTVDASVLTREPHVRTGAHAVTRILREKGGLRLLPAWMANARSARGPEPGYAHHHYAGSETQEGWSHVDRFGAAKKSTARGPTLVFSFPDPSSAEGREQRKRWGLPDDLPSGGVTQVIDSRGGRTTRVHSSEELASHMRKVRPWPR